MTADAQTGVNLDVMDGKPLGIACRPATRVDWLAVNFQQDPSKISLEILLVAADKADGQLVTVVHDLEHAAVTLGVLERGSVLR